LAAEDMRWRWGLRTVIIGSNLSTFGIAIDDPVCSQHSASQDTLRDCTKCRGILAYARSKALSRTESDEVSSRSCCAQLTI
jgi:hypothetical protein